MSEFIEVTKIYDFGSSCEQHNKLIINMSSIQFVEDVHDTTIIELDGDRFFIIETYEEIKAMLGVGNETKLA